jgi:hypothetical protein
LGDCLIPLWRASFKGNLRTKGETTMFRKIAIYGIVAGLIAGVPLSVIIVVTRHEMGGTLGMIVGYLTMLIALTAIFIAIKRHRDVDLGGVIKFLPALGLGLGISVIAGILYTACWDATLAITHMDFAGGYAKAMIADAQARGVTGTALAKVTAEMDQFKTQYANPLYRWPMTFIEIFPVGVLVSLISAGLLCNRRFLPARRS